MRVPVDSLRTALGGAAAAAAIVLVLAGCDAGSARPSTAPTVTVVATPSGSPSASPSATAASTPAPDGPDTSGTQPSSSVPATPASDPGRPAGQCPDSALGVGITRAADGGAAGSAYYDLLLTNTGGESCDLRGAPGVSVVSGEQGDQVGPPADRDQSGAQTLRLAAGDTVEALLQVTNIGDGGGPLGSACHVRKGRGYRVYPPHSTRAYFVPDATAVACTGSTVFMQVGTLKPR